VVKLQRTTFKTSRAAQYVEARALQAMTGQSRGHFADVVVKELMDNALDACETAGVPPEVGLEVARNDQEIRIAVSDNGPGIPPETVRGALDFGVLVSDKAAYRSPTRGAQGSALKAVFGIPHALGSLEPVVIEARGLRHEVRVWKDPAGELRVKRDETDIARADGTRVEVRLPSRWQRGHLTGWERAYALYNPHASIKIRPFSADVYQGNQGKSPGIEFEDFYRPTRDSSKRFKYLPSDPTSAHWYDEEAFKRLIYSHIGHARSEANGGADLLLRDFVRQFKGLSATKKAKVVCDAFPDIKTLSDFENAEPTEIAYLLDCMKRHSDAPSHTTLGYVGREHFERCFRRFYGRVYRFGYKKISGVLPSGMPYIFQFAIAEVEGQGEVFTGVNFSPTFDDPLQDERFRAQDRNQTVEAEGVDGFLEDCFAHPLWDHDDDPDPPFTAAAAHIITPAPLFLDYGKTRLEGFSSREVRRDIAQAMFSQLKPYLKEGKRRIRNCRARERQEDKANRAEKQMSLKDATWVVLEDAWRHTTGNGRLPVGSRRLFYAVRSRIPEVTDKRFATDTGYNYFSQTLLPEYQKQRVAVGEEPLANVYYDPRGKIYEPHTGRAMDLGTRDVESYEFPSYTFNKLLFVEKRGQVPLLQAAKIAERYDLALVTEAGFATVAARTLLSAGSEGEKYQVFCLHDADYPGYNILRTLREATERMPEHSMEVHDIGLTVEQVIAADKTPETYHRTSKVPEKLIPLLNDVEREWFLGEYLGKKGNKNTYSSKRFELDDLTAPELIDHIERRLEELGVEPKVIPPQEELAGLVEGLYREKLGTWVENEINELLGIADLKAELAEEYQERYKLQGARAWIKTEFEHGDDSKSWRDAVRDTLQAAHTAKHRDALRDALRERISKTVAVKDEDEK
jgi:hypothetical protein